jgi:hypothetical protein
MELTWEALKNQKIFDEDKTENEAIQEATNDLIGHLGYNPYDIDNPVGTDGKLNPNAQELWNTGWLQKPQFEANRNNRQWYSCLIFQKPFSGIFFEQYQVH